MRKILLVVIIVLLLALGYVTLTNGLQFGDFQILSMREIEDESKNLKAKIEEANMLIDVDFPNRINDLHSASNKLENTKSEYLKYTNLSSDEEILAARTEKSYAIEFLWAKLGTHARQEGINLKFEITGSNTGANNVNDLKFTVDGSYIAITNFIYSIENNSELDFRIQNFKLLPYQQEILQGTFNVPNISIQGNTSTQNLGTTGQSNEQSQQNADANANSNANANANANANTNTTAQ